MEISAQLRVTGCRDALIFMHVRLHDGTPIGARGGSAQFNPGQVNVSIVGTVPVPDREGTVLLDYLMMLDARSGQQLVARLEYPVH